MSKTVEITSIDDIGMLTKAGQSFIVVVGDQSGDPDKALKAEAEIDAIYTAIEDKFRPKPHTHLDPIADLDGLTATAIAKKFDKEVTIQYANALSQLTGNKINTEGNELPIAKRIVKERNAYLAQRKKQQAATAKVVAAAKA